MTTQFMSCVIRAVVVRARLRHQPGSVDRVPRARPRRSSPCVAVRCENTDTPTPAPKVHFLGIGGAGISALAIIALSNGYRVSGSDMRDSDVLEVVRKKGATCFVGHDVRNVSGVEEEDAGPGKAEDDTSEERNKDKDATRNINTTIPDAVVVSSAVPSNNVEVRWARQHGIPVFTRSQWLARTTKGKTVIAVAGTHGKTTTSAMLATTLLDLNLDISAVIGGRVAQFPDSANAVGGKNKIFVIEADEYDGAFLGLTPSTAVLLNCEMDHPDIFRGVDDVVQLFKQFVGKVGVGGSVIANGDDANVRLICENKSNVITFGVGKENEYRAVDLTPNEHGGTSFTVTHFDTVITQVSITQPGEYQVRNALAAYIAASVTLETSTDSSTNPDTSVLITTSLETHLGVARRMQLIGSCNVGQNNITCHVYDDYAHHPTAVAAVIEAAKQKHEGAEIIVLFQPHTFFRVSLMLGEFTKALRLADTVIVTQVFDARPEKDLKSDGRREFGEDIVNAIGKEKGFFAHSFDEAVERAVSEGRRDDMSLAKESNPEKQVVVLCLGAGAGFDAAEKVFQELRNE